MVCVVCVVCVDSASMAASIPSLLGDVGVERCDVNSD